MVGSRNIGPNIDRVLLESLLQRNSLKNGSQLLELPYYETLVFATMAVVRDYGGSCLQPGSTNGLKV